MYMKTHTCDKAMHVNICDENDMFSCLSTGSGNGLVLETELDEAGNILMPEVAKQLVRTIPGGKIWLYLTNAGITAIMNEDRCRICGERMDEDSPYVICARCIRDIREVFSDDETPDTICS